MVLTLLKQSSAIITASGTKSHVQAYESTYRAIAKKIAATTSGRRQLQSTDPASFLGSYETLMAIITSAAAMANVRPDAIVIMIAANTSAAMIEATSTMLVANQSADAAVPSTKSWFQSLAQLNLADEQLTAQSTELARGVYNGSLQAVDIELPNGASVLALASQQANGTDFLNFACGEPSATNYVPGGNSTGACRYPSPPPPATQSDAAVHIVLDVFAGLCVVVLIGFIGTMLFCYSKKQQQARTKDVDLLRERSMHIKRESVAPKKEMPKRKSVEEVSPKQGLVEMSAPRSDDNPKNTAIMERSGAVLADQI
jgi:hypothetical protein